MLHNNILDLKDKFDIFLFDAYGVFWNGGDFYKDSLKNMNQLLKEGKVVYVISNVAKSSFETEKDYDSKGLIKNVHYHEMITSGEAIRQAFSDKTIFKENFKKVYQFGTINPKIFDGTKYETTENLSEADFVYISVPQFNEKEYNVLVEKGYKEHLFEVKIKDGETRKWNTENIELFKEKIQDVYDSKLPVVNANPDLKTPTVEKISDKTNFVIRQGSIAEELKKMGVEVAEFGKPEASIFNCAFNLLKKNGVNTENKSKICMVGDTLRTDIKGANNFGIQSVLCWNTGITRNEINDNFEFFKEKNLAETVKYFEEKYKVFINYLIKGVGNER